MYSKARQHAMTAIAIACVAGGLYLLLPVAMHHAAQAILASNSVKKANAAPDFTLKDAKGRKVSLSDYKGKVVVLNFWATWCGPCKAEIPWFVAFQKEYQAKGFTVLGVSMDEDGWKVINPFVEDHSIDYPILLGDEKVNQLYGGIDALPTTLIIGRDGNVAFLHAGLISRAEYEKEIQGLL